MFTPEQLISNAPAPNDILPIPAAVGAHEDVDPVWVIAHALGEAASSCEDVVILTQVCRSWRNYIGTVKDELYGAILPRRFPRLRYLSLVLDPSKQVLRISKEERYRRHLKAQVVLCPHHEEVWENLQGRALIDPDIACMLEVWLDANPILFAALSSVANKKQDSDSAPLTELLKDMHAKEEQFLKKIIDDEENNHAEMESDDLAALYDKMNKHCGWDKLSVMMYVSNGDEVVRVCRSAFLLAVHDRYMFGNSLQVPKLVLNQEGMIGLPMQDDVELEVGAMVKSSAVGERIVVEGLTSAQQHNGKEGAVSERIVETGRFRVTLDTGEVLSIKSSNLRLATEARATLTAEDKQHIMRLKLFVISDPLLRAEVLANFPDPSQPLG